jgi:calcineurin-like phosphoesterase family protein
MRLTVTRLGKTLLCLGALLVLTATLPGAARAESRVTLTPATGPGGTNASLRGLHFGRNDRVVVKLGRRTLARTRTTRHGSFKASFTVPAGGRSSKKIVSRSLGRRVVNVFRFSASTSLAQAREVASRKGRRLRWTATGRSVGSTVVLRGSRFPPNRRVRIRLGGVQVGAARTNRLGEFSESFTVPAIPLGRHLLRVKPGPRALGASFGVTADPLVAAAGDIACDPEDPNFNGGNGTAELCHMRQTSDLVLGARPAAVLALGDLQYEAGSLEDFTASYAPTWGRLKSITRPVPGNHEYGIKGAKGYFDYFNGEGVNSGPAGDRDKGYYSFDVGAWHLIALNSNCSEFGLTCGGGFPQANWLRADLAAHRNRCVLAYWHHPLYSSGQQGNHPTMHDIFAALYEAGADLVLTGHDHYYERFGPLTPEGVPDPARGIREFIVGTGGRDLQRTKKPIKNDSQVRHFETFGVLALRLHPDSYDWEFLPEAGKTFRDSGTQPCH